MVFEVPAGGVSVVVLVVVVVVTGAPGLVDSDAILVPQCTIYQSLIYPRGVGSYPQAGVQA